MSLASLSIIGIGVMLMLVLIYGVSKLSEE
jgi:hypothetical protein